MGIKPIMEALPAFQLPFDVTILVVTTGEECESGIRRLIQDDSKDERVLGFDLEWVPYGKKEPANPVALLQLSGNKIILLIRLKLMCIDSQLPACLVDLLQDGSFVKTGVAIRYDAKLLSREYGIHVANCVDLAKMAHLPDCGLSALCEMYMGVHMDKSKDVRCCNWAAEILTQEQIIYAASDAWISRELYFKIEPNTNVIQDHVSAPTRKRKRNSKNFKSSKDTFVNCHMLSPDGKTIASCGLKTLTRLVSKNNAIVVNQNPLQIQLKNNPRYYHKVVYLDKPTYCVRCGEKNALCKMTIIPRCYMLYFPKQPSGLSGQRPKDVRDNLFFLDCFLLCRDCLALNTNRVGDLIEKVSSLYNIDNSPPKQDKEITKINVTARALLFAPNIPEKRIIELKARLRLYFNLESIDNVTQDIIEHAFQLSPYIGLGDQQLNKEAFVKSLDSAKLQEFIVLCRQHFITYMQPKFMPEKWSIDRIVV